MSKFSVITAASRSVDIVRQLRRQFREQTFADFEHLIVYDGPPPDEVRSFFETEQSADARVRFEWLSMKEGRYGTAPRNRGIDLARGEWIVFADDDDLYHPDFLRGFADLGLRGNMLGVVRLNNYGTIIPRHDLSEFPRECHVATPSCCFPAQWFREQPDLRWKYGEYNHDFLFVRDCIEHFHPEVKLNPRVLVKAGNAKLLPENGLTGKRAEEYLSWNEPTAWMRTFSPSKSDRWLSRQMYHIGATLRQVGK